jgi:hypothetical protein
MKVEGNDFKGRDCCRCKLKQAILLNPIYYHELYIKHREPRILTQVSQLVNSKVRIQTQTHYDLELTLFPHPLNNPSYVSFIFINSIFTVVL